MIFIVDWITFQTRTIEFNIYVDEKKDRWDLYAPMQTREVLKCSVLKSDEEVENKVFVERYLANRENVIKVLSVGQNTPVIKVEALPELPEEDHAITVLPSTAVKDQQVIEQASKESEVQNDDSA